MYALGDLVKVHVIHSTIFDVCLCVLYTICIDNLLIELTKAKLRNFVD